MKNLLSFLICFMMIIHQVTSLSEQIGLSSLDTKADSLLSKFLNNINAESQDVNYSLDHEIIQFKVISDKLKNNFLLPKQRLFAEGLTVSKSQHLEDDYFSFESSTLGLHKFTVSEFKQKAQKIIKSMNVTIEASNCSFLLLGFMKKSFEASILKVLRKDVENYLENSNSILDSEVDLSVYPTEVFILKLHNLPEGNLKSISHILGLSVIHINSSNSLEFFALCPYSRDEKPYWKLHFTKVSEVYVEEEIKELENLEKECEKDVGDCSGKVTQVVTHFLASESIKEDTITIGKNISAADSPKEKITIQDEGTSDEEIKVTKMIGTYLHF